MKKKIIYVTPHTHWDREWMFTEQTGNVALNRYMLELKKTIENDKNFKLLLDGQVSLLNDYISWNPNKKDEIIKLMKKGNIALGPWYAQPDVFSTLGETTFLNLEIAKKVLDHLDLPRLTCAYMPDTFGFHQNLPQIFNLNELDTFVHWRGLDIDQIKDFAIHWWEGIDGTKILSSTYKDGYHGLPGYHYHEFSDENHFNEKVDNFIKSTRNFIAKHFESLGKDSNVAMVPLGWDQVPVQYNITKFIKAVNDKDESYEWKVTNDFDDFFNIYKNKKELPIFTGDLKTAVNGRVHRTIGSSRYDIKKQFRKCELALYYRLEPLEIIYSSIDSMYDFEEYKDNNIIKPLIKSSAHDSLGGCNSDKTNRDIVAKLNQIYEEIMSQIDLLTYKIGQMKRKGKKYSNTLFSYNLLPAKRNIYKIVKIYSDIKEINFKNEDGDVIKSLRSRNFSFDGKREKYEHICLIYSKNVEGLGIKEWNISDSFEELDIAEKQNFLKLDGENINLKVKDKYRKIKFDFESGNSDGYDYSPAMHKEFIKVDHTVKNMYSFENIQVVEVESETSKKTKINTLFIKTPDGNIDIKIKVKNNLPTHKVSLIIDGSGSIYKSQGMIISKMDNDKNEENWKEKMLERPVNVGINDGVITFDRKWGILTKGTNEFFKQKNGLKLTLFRTHNLVSNQNMAWRPGRPSGLTYKEASIDSQLMKEINISLRLFEGDMIRNLNDWNFQPLFSYKNNIHLTGNRMNKFIVNDIQQNSNPIKSIYNINVNVDNLWLSRLSRLGEKILIRTSNPLDTPYKNYKKYQIKKEII